MRQQQLPTSSHHIFQAYHLTELLKLKEIDRLLGGEAVNRSSTRLIYQEGKESYFFLYRFGSVVFFNVEPARQTQIIEKIRAMIGAKMQAITSEEFAIDVRKEGPNAVGFESATLDSLSIERIDLLALVLAESTALEYFEFAIDDLLRQTSEIGGELQHKGKMRRSEQSINRFIGFCMTTKQNLVSSMYLLDKPDETWNDQVLDSLFRDASEMFELRDRYRTIDYKLKMIQENLELIADLLKNRRATILELSIIALIAVEIILIVYELFVK